VHYRRPCVLLAVLVLLGVMSPALAGSNHPPVRLVVFGDQLVCDVPPRIVEGRTLVPVRALCDKVGAQVTWVPEIRTVEVQLGETHVSIPVGSKTAFVNRQPVKLDVPAVIEDGHTLVPVRFVADALGLEVWWDEETRTVLVDKPSPPRIVGLSWSQLVGHGRLEIQLDRAAGSALLHTLDDPPRLLIDLPDAVLAPGVTGFPVRAGGVHRVRTATLADGTGTRLICDLGQPVRYWMDKSSDGTRIFVNIAYQLLGVAFEKAVGVQAVYIRTNGPVEYRVWTLTDPLRLVIDLPGLTVHPAANRQLEVDSPALRAVRVGQFQVDPDISRVVLDLKRQNPYAVTVEGNGLRVWLLSSLVDVDWEVEGGRVRVALEADYPLLYNAAFVADKQCLRIDLPCTVVAVSQREYASADGHARMTIDQFEASPTTTRVELWVASYQGHRIVTAQDGRRLLVEVFSSPLFGKRIALDPGHGGDDPGAVGSTGLKEKDVNLALAEALAARLRGSGARVLLVREGNDNPSTYERVARANAWGADLYLSIHCNSFWDPRESGTETYYSGSHRDNLVLARTVHRHLVEALGLVDRGLRRADGFVVVREPRMPSALVEVCFLSNPREEQLLLSDAFRERIVQALYEGILEFFQR